MRSTTIGLRLDDDEIRDLRAAAKYDGTTPQALIRKLLKEEMRRRECFAEFDLGELKKKRKK